MNQLKQKENQFHGMNGKVRDYCPGRYTKAEGFDLGQGTYKQQPING